MNAPCSTRTEGARRSPATSRPTTHGSGDETVLAATPVVVRRNAGLAAVIGAAASAIAIAYLWRAVDTGAPLDWALCAVLALIARLLPAGLLDARTPLVVADDLGVRIRLGNAVARPALGRRRRGRGAPAPQPAARRPPGLPPAQPRPRARRARGARPPARPLNQKMYGAALAVPLGLTTRTSAGADDGRRGPRRAVPRPRRRARGRPRAGVDAAAEQPRRTPPTHRDRWPLGTSSRRGRADRRPPGPQRLVRPAPPPRRDVAAAEGAEATDRPAGADSAADSEPDRHRLRLDEVTVDAAGETRGHAPRRSLLGGIGTIVSRVAKANAHDVDVEKHGLEPAAAGTDEDLDAAEAAQTPRTRGRRRRRAGHPARAPSPRCGPPAGAARRRSRATPRRPRWAPPRSTTTVRTTGGRPARGTRAAPPGQRRPGLRAGRDAPRSGRSPRLGDPVEPLVIDDFVTEPAYDPVIGPALAAARTRVGLTVDELAERTRIRPHVIESIEVDDFAPCGGDFYARGHLRTLARVLGQDPAPLLEQFDNRYATAPDQRPPGVRGRARDRDDRQHAQHRRRTQLGPAGRRRAQPGAGVGPGPAVRHRAAAARR